MADVPSYNEETEILYMEDGVYKVMNKQEAYDRGYLIRPEDVVPIELPTPVLTATVTALAELAVDGEEVSGVGVVANFGGAFQLMPGTFWVFFANPQPDTNYAVSVQVPGFNADVTYPLNTDYIEITVSDRATGEAATPSRLILDVKRVQ